MSRDGDAPRSVVPASLADAVLRFQQSVREHAEQLRADEASTTAIFAGRKRRLEAERTLARADRNAIARLVAAVVKRDPDGGLTELVGATPPTVHNEEAAHALAGLRAHLTARAAEMFPDLEPESDSGHDIDSEPPADRATAEGAAPPADAEAQDEAKAASPAAAPVSGAMGDGGAAVQSAPPTGASVNAPDSQVRRCPVCRAVVPHDATDCPECGHLLPPRTSSEPSATMLVTPAEVEDWEPRGGRAWRPGALLLTALVTGIALFVLYVNARPQFMSRVAFLCQVPGAASVLPCKPSTPAGFTTSIHDIRNGGQVTVPAGSFTLRTPLTLRGNVTIKGAGSGVSDIEVTGDGTGLEYLGGGTLVLNGVQLHRAGGSLGDVLTIRNGTIHIEDVSVDGGRASSSLAGAGILIEGNTSGTISNCYVRNNVFGIMVTGYAAPTLRGNTIADNLKRGASYHDHSGGRLEDNTIRHNGYNSSGQDFWQGVGLEGHAAPTITGNTIQGNAGVGIQYRDSSAGTAGDNRILGNGVNIPLYAPKGSSAGGIAIGAAGTTQSPNPTVLGSNSFDGNYGGGVRDYRHPAG